AVALRPRQFHGPTSPSGLTLLSVPSHVDESLGRRGDRRGGGDRRRGVQPGAGRQPPLIHVAPEGDEKFARERDNADSPQPRAPVAGGPPVPLTEGALRLIAKPPPGQFNHHRAQLATAIARDPLFARPVPALDRRRRA